MAPDPLEQGPMPPGVHDIEPGRHDPDGPGPGRASALVAPSPLTRCSAASAACSAPWCAAPSTPIARPDTTETPAAPRKAPSSQASANP